MKYSIIVPVYNVENYINECIQSVLSQTMNDYEIILVDDGSLDECPAICDEWAKKESRIKVIHKKNGGISSARNEGIRQSKGRYLLFLDSDDYWVDANVLKKIDAYINRNDVDILCFGYQEYIEENRSMGKMLFDESNVFNIPEDIEPLLCDAMKKGIYVSSAWTKVISKEFIFKHDLFFEENTTSEDIDWSARILLQVQRVCFLPENLYIYRQRKNSIVHTVKVENIQMLADNIKRCVDYGMDNPGNTLSTIYWNYVSYQYCTFLIHACKSSNNEKVQMIINDMRNYRWLLKYHWNQKVKMVYLLDLLGFKTMCKVMSVYGKRRI